MSKHKRDKSSNSNRRTFLKVSGVMTASALGAAVLPDVARGQSGPASNPLPFNLETSNSMPTRNLGKTGYKVGIFSLGGQAALEKPHQRSSRGTNHRSPL
jgi:hypothetical protein